MADPVRKPPGAAGTSKKDSTGSDNVAGRRGKGCLGGCWLGCLETVVGRYACIGVTAQHTRWHLGVHISLVSVADSGPFCSASTTVNQPAPFHHRLPDPAWLFLRSTGRLVWGERKQLRRLTDLSLWSLKPLSVGQPCPWHAAGGRSAWPRVRLPASVPHGDFHCGWVLCCQGNTGGWPEARTWPCFILSS